MDKDAHFTVADLRARGWTDKLIKDLLDTPDATRKNPRFSSAAPMRLYLKTRALAVEDSESWVALCQKASAWRDAAGRATQTKKDQLLAYVNGLSVHVPVIPLSEATATACENFNDFKEQMAFERGDYEFRGATKDSDPLFLQRITVNYLRHRLSRYERELERLFGKVGVREAYRTLNTKVYAAIAAAYPELADECRRQEERKRLEPSC